MTSPKTLLALLLLAGFFSPVQAYAADLVIGYVELKPDARYAKRRTFARYLTQALGRPFKGAETALKEARKLAHPRQLDDYGRTRTPHALSSAERDGSLSRY